MFRVATYNVQNYIEMPSGTRPAKSEAARAKIRESIRATKADVIALQEMGNTNALLELRDNLKRDGCDFPFWEHVSAWDTNIHVAVLSRFPIVARRPHTNDSFALFNKQFHVKRGFAEVDIQVNARYTFTLLTAHLKSKLTNLMRTNRNCATRKRRSFEKRSKPFSMPVPNANVIVAGDLNDVRDSKPVRTIVAAGRKNALHDTRPAEQNGDDQPNNNPRYPAPQITWTHYYGKEDTYRRIDYIFLEQRHGARVGEPGDVHYQDSQLGGRLRPPSHRRYVYRSGRLKRLQWRRLIPVPRLCEKNHKTACRLKTRAVLCVVTIGVVRTPTYASIAHNDRSSATTRRSRGTSSSPASMLR